MITKLGQDVPTEELDRRRVVCVSGTDDHVLDAGFGQTTEALDDLVGCLRRRARGALSREANRLQVRPLDLGEVSPDRLAMFGQDRAFRQQLRRSAEQVRGVGVLGDESQVFFSPPPTMWIGTRRGRSTGGR